MNEYKVITSSDASDFERALNSVNDTDFRLVDLDVDSGRMVAIFIKEAKK